MLPGGQSGFSRGLLAEVQELTNRVAERGQRFVFLLGNFFHLLHFFYQAAMYPRDSCPALPLNSFSHAFENGSEIDRVQSASP